MRQLANIFHSFVYSALKSEVKGLNGGNKANELEVFLKEAVVAWREV
jgi:hypothetical protein